MGVQTSSITSGSNEDITINPAGTGEIVLPALSPSQSTSKPMGVVDSSKEAGVLNFLTLAEGGDPAANDLVLIQRGSSYIQANAGDFGGTSFADPTAPEDIQWAPSTPPGSGTQEDPYILTAKTVGAVGGTVDSDESVTIINQKSGSTLLVTEISGSVGVRMDQPNRQIGTDGSTPSFAFTYRDTPNTVTGQVYTGDIRLGNASIYVRWSVTQVANNTSFGPISQPNASPASVNYAGDSKYGTVTGTWADGARTLNASGLAFKVNESALNSTSKGVLNGDAISVAFIDSEVAAAVDGATITGTLTSTDGAYFSQMQLVKDSNPAAPTFQSISNAATSTQASTNTVYLTGFNAPATVTASGTSANPLTSVTLSINGATPVGNGTIIPGQTLQGFGTTGAAPSTVYQASFTAGDSTSVWQATTAAATAVIVTPSIISPTDGATGLIPTVTLAGSAYSPLNGAGTHSSSTWEVYQADAIFDQKRTSPIVTATNFGGGEVSLVTTDNSNFGFFNGGTSVIQDSPLFLTLGSVTSVGGIVTTVSSTSTVTFPKIGPACGQTLSPISTGLVNPNGTFTYSVIRDWIAGGVRTGETYTSFIIITVNDDVRVCQTSRQYMFGANQQVLNEDISRCEFFYYSNGIQDAQPGFQFIEDGQTERTCGTSVLTIARPGGWFNCLPFLGSNDFRGFWMYASTISNMGNSKNLGVPFFKIWPSDTSLEPYYIQDSQEITLNSNQDMTSLAVGQSIYHLNEFPNGTYYHVRNTAPADVGPNYTSVNVGAIAGWAECSTEVQEVTTESAIARTIPTAPATSEENSNVVLIDFRFPTKFVYTKFFVSTGTSAQVGLFGSATGVRGSWIAIAQGIGVDPSVSSLVPYRYYAIVRFDQETNRTLVGIDPAYPYQTAANARVTSVNIGANKLQIQPAIGTWDLSTVAGAQILGGTALAGSGTVKTTNPGNNTIVIENSNGTWIAGQGKKVMTREGLSGKPGAPVGEPPSAAVYTAVTPSSTTLTTATLDGTDLISNKYYYSRVKYADNGSVVSNFSNYNEFGTKSSFILEPGEAVGGGYYAGQIRGSGSTSGGGLDDSNVIYNLIVAPISSGGLSGETTAQWKTGQSGDTSSYLRNTEFGSLITNDLADSSHPGFNWAINSATGPNAGASSGGTGIGGFNDWYCPARCEMLILYYTFKPSLDANYSGTGSNGYAVAPIPGGFTPSNPTQTSVLAFQSGGSEAFTYANNIATGLYWLSSQKFNDPSEADHFTFLNATEQGNGKTANYKWRAVRRDKA
jgi:hypothetical protein